MIQHDMMMWDHGMPRADGTLNPEQRPEADVNIEFQSTAKMADEAMKLAFFFHRANERYATDYPATVGPHMTNTDSTPFMDIMPAISLRENERGAHTGGGWDPHWHQPTDVLLDVQRQGLPARPQRRADDAGRGGAADGGEAEEVGPPRLRRSSTVRSPRIAPEPCKDGSGPDTNPLHWPRSTL